MSAIKYISEKEGVSRSLNFYLAEQVDKEKDLYVYQDLGKHAVNNIKRLPGYSWFEETLARRKKEVPFNLEAELKKEARSTKRPSSP